MKPVNLHKIALALFALLLAASCDKEEFAGRPADDGQPQPIRFDIAMATATAAPSGASTRVTTATDYTSTFTAGDRVGLYIVKGGGGELQSSGNWVDNALLTFDGTEWTCHLPEGKEYFPRDGSPLSFYAYYPYNAQLADARAIEFAVPSDQSTDAGFASAYLMSASEMLVSREHAPVRLEFTHQLALLRVNLKDGDQPKDKAPRPADVVTLKGMQLMTTLDDAMTSGGGMVTGDFTDVKMHYNTADGCWYALVPPQMVVSGSGLLTFQWTGITTLNHKAGQIFILHPGKVNQLDITIDVNMTIDPRHVYAVGDAYPYVGFYDKQGVVFEVSNGGKSGKIIGLKREPSLAWSTEFVFTGISDDDNGRLNMEGFRNRDGFDKYPAMKWVHGLNPQGTTYGAQSTGIWYLPARNEMKAVCKEQMRVILAPVLKALGMENPFPWGFAWTSTDWTNNNVSTTLLANGLGMTQRKESVADKYTWPILAF